MQFLKYHEARERGTGNFPVELYQIDPSHSRYIMVCHWHAEYEIIHVLAGRLVCRIGENTFTANPGDILFINEGELHAAVPENCRYECLVFDMGKLLKTHGACAACLSGLRAEGRRFANSIEETTLQKHILALFAACKKPMADGQYFVICGYLFTLFGMFMQQKVFSDEAAHSQTQLAVSRLKRVLDFIENNYTAHISLEELADIAEMSSKYFCTFFKKMTGSTPIEYLKQYRISAACLMMSDPTRTITDIAMDCGFNDLSYFIHEFKAAKGITPKQYQAGLPTIALP